MEVIEHMGRFDEIEECKIYGPGDQLDDHPTLACRNCLGPNITTTILPDINLVAVSLGW